MGRRLIVFLLLCLILSGCAVNYYHQGRRFLRKKDYEKATEIFYQAVTRDPQKAENWRELGIAYYEKGEPDKALDALKQANLIKPDQRINFYLGLIYDRRGKCDSSNCDTVVCDSAIEAYSRYLLIKSKTEGQKEMAKMVKARLKILQDQRIKKWAQHQVANEENLRAAEIPSNTVVVTYFDTSELDTSLAVLSKGLTEFLIKDLSKVKNLKVVERLKLQRLSEELEREKTPPVDKRTAPELGLLLGAYHLVTGSMMDMGRKILKFVGAAVVTPTHELSSIAEKTGGIGEFLKLEKELVFGILDAIGIMPTKMEKDEIRKIPTESFMAIFAYSRGLDYLDREMYKDAEKQFRIALSEDPDFHDALIQYHEVKDFLEHQSSVEDLSSLEMVYKEIEEAEFTDPLEERLSQTNENSDLIQPISADNPYTQPFIPCITQTGTVVIEGTLEKR